MRRLHNSKFSKPAIQTGHISPTKLERQMYMKLGKLNRCNPDKITSNTHIQNPTDMTAQYLYKKKFADLSQDQKVAVYRFLTPAGIDIKASLKGRPSVPSKTMSQ